MQQLATSPPCQVKLVKRPGRQGTRVRMDLRAEHITQSMIFFVYGDGTSIRDLGVFINSQSRLSKASLESYVGRSVL